MQRMNLIKRDGATVFTAHKSFCCIQVGYGITVEMSAGLRLAEYIKELRKRMCLIGPDAMMNRTRVAHCLAVVQWCWAHNMVTLA